jgi:hypothetical protein
MNSDTFELNPCPDADKVRSVTAALGNLDAAAILIMVIFGIIFEKWWVNKIVEDNDAGNITPADFGLVWLALMWAG